MSKMRVHELAKELSKSSKDIIYALKSHGVVVESHMSTIGTDTAEKIRRYFKPAPKAEENTAPQQKPVAQQKPATQGAVGARPVNQGGQQRPQGDRPVYNNNRNNDNRGQQRPQGDRPAYNNNRNNDNRGQQRPQGDRPAYNNNRYNNDNRGQQRPQGDRPAYNNNRPNNGDRPAYNNNRPNNGDRPAYNNNRPNNGDRPAYNNNRYNNDNRGQQRPQGDRPAYNNNRPNNGDRPAYNNNRPNNGDRPNNFRNDNRQGSYNGGNRQGSYNGNRPDNRRPGGPGNDRNRTGSRDAAPTKDVLVTKDSLRDNKWMNKDKDKAGNKNGPKKNNRNMPKQGLQRRSPLSKPTPKPKPVVEKVTEIELPEVLTLKELGDKMKIVPADIIKKLFLSGKMVTLNTEITYDEAEEIAMEYDVLCTHEVVVDVIEELLKEDDEAEDEMVTRPPVVCVMGHVDHGKTSILDAIRKTSVTVGEAGGITQHIGAYVVEASGQKVTFLDTPGHEAFTAMRLRGAQATDIAILVVAADDGVMPQTIEAINHAKAADIEIIVAINKVDKPSANIDRVKQELTEYGLVAEDWGGQCIMVPVSAHTGEGLSELLDMILLVSEVKELKANPNRNARGLVIEAQLDKGRGPVATVLVQKGTLNVGDTVAVGTSYGRVRAMIDDKGRRVKVAGPSTPVEILGLNDVPLAGEVFVATDSEKEARAFAETFIATNREKMLKDTKSKLSLDGLFDQIQAGNIKELNIIVKADVQGSVEAVKQSLAKLSNDEVAVKVIHGGVGAINESDVTLASASNAIIIGFNVRPDNMAKTVSEAEKVDIRLYRVIYNAIEDVEAAMKGMLDPTFEEKIIGHAEVRQTYKVSGVGTIIGGYVIDGKVMRNCGVRLLRDDVVIHEGELASLKRFKDDVKEVNTGYECGMSFEKYNDIKEGDKIECFVMEEVAR